MTLPVSLLPPMLGANLGAPVVPELSQDEQGLMSGLASKLMSQAVDVQRRYLYYDGQQRMQNLGILVPPQLSSVRTVVDWPRICVDPLLERTVVDGFRAAGATDDDEELLAHWRANDMASEAPLAFLDAFVTGRGYMIVGAPDEPGDSPLMTVESPLNMSMQWDPRTRQTTAAFQAYEAEGVFRAVLYLPDQTISMSRNQTTEWAIDGKDEHGFGEVPVVRLVNRARSSDREGRSEITAPIMNTTDSACRSLLGMEIAREFYSIPHRYILGATESDFVDASGNSKSALDLAMNKFLAIERDDQGNVPTVGQFAAFDPSVFTKIIDMHAQLMASYTGYPPAYFGINATANPAAGDALRAAENRLIRRAEQAQAQFTSALRRLMRLTWRFAHDGQQMPDEIRRLEVDWISAATPTPAATTDAITKQVQIGAIPATSDVTLAELGWSAVQRQRLAVDRQVDAGASVLAELATSLQAKEARVDTTIARDINPAAAKAAPPVNPLTGAVASAPNVDTQPQANVQTGR